jgi:biopolymer transport protein ExbD
MAEINISSKNKRKNSFSGSTKYHRSTRVDLTPMVDLGFLLITFFVFTSAMSRPMAMDLIEPKDGEEKPVPQSGAMTILLGKDHQVYYYYKKLNDGSALDQIKKTGFKEIRSLITEMNNRTALRDLMYIIKSGKYATFGDHINLLDEMTICNIPNGHYAETDMTKPEAEMINK